LCWGGAWLSAKGTRIEAPKVLRKWDVGGVFPPHWEGCSPPHWIGVRRGCFDFCMENGAFW